MSDNVKIVALLVILVVGVAVCIAYSSVMGDRTRANKEIECIKNGGTMVQMVGRYSKSVCQKQQ